MKKKIVYILIFVAVLALLYIRATISTHAVKGEEGMIATARKEIHNISEIDKIEIRIAGKSTVGDKCLVWFITGNEYQAHSYVPMEFTILQNEEFAFSHRYNGIKRGRDIYCQIWGYGYSFLVNNGKCKSIKLEGHDGIKIIPVDSIPFVCYYFGFPGEYEFLDENGKPL